MENIDYLSDVFLPPWKRGIYKHHIIFFSLLDIMNWYYMTTTRGHCFETNKKRVHHFVLMMTPSMFCLFCFALMDCFAFLDFPAINIEFFLFISRNLFSRYFRSLNVPIFHFTLKFFLYFVLKESNF